MRWLFLALASHADLVAHVAGDGFAASRMHVVPRRVPHGAWEEIMEVLWEDGASWLMELMEVTF